MKIINRKSREVQQSRPTIVRLDDKGFYFGTPAMREFNLTPGAYLEFINDDKRWSFCVVNDPDGFKISNGDKSKGVYVFHTGLARLFRKSVQQYASKISYYLRESKAEIDGRVMIEILTEKPLVVIDKK